MTITKAIRLAELLKMVPLSASTIYQLENRGDFPKRFALTSRCVVWDYDEVVAWLDARKEAASKPLSKPDVRNRKTRPVRNSG
ncbi:MAG: phage transcriptional regulator, AlpA [Rhodocyclaceae bacterium]|nr:phage transcriptional regulator, AlpA [Rhodocyclaceae bacterium]